MVDLTGRRFGRLTVLKQKGRTADRNVLWECLCDCKNIVIISSKSLLAGSTKSCGCLNRELAKQSHSKKDLGHWDIYKNTRINLLNETIPKNNTTGVRGVSFDSVKGKYRVRINLQHKTYQLGYFDTLEEAKKAREEAEKEIWNPIKTEYKDVKEKENAD